MSFDPEPRGQQPLPSEPYYRRGEQARRWGALLLLIGVVWLVFELTVRSSIFGIGVGRVEQTEQLPAQSFSAEQVLINGVNDDIKLVPGSGDTIIVEATKHAFGWNTGAANGALSRLDMATEQRGDTLVIDLRPTNRLGFAIGRVPYLSLRVSLPAGVRAEAAVVSGDITAQEVRSDLVLRSVSGAVHAEDTAGALRATTTSGDVRIRDHSGGLVIETTSGDISAAGALNAPRLNSVSGAINLQGAISNLELRTISGDIEVRDATDASLVVESTSGDVSFDGALASDSDSRISTISGDVRVRLASPDDLRLELRTTSGELSNELSLPTNTEERRRLSGTLGAGETSLSIETTSGDIEVAGR